MEPAVGPATPGVQRIATAEQAAAVAASLNDARRTRPVVVVSVPSGARGPWIDAERIGGELDGLAEVRLLLPEASWRFAEAMPSGTQVYGGAGRVYPIGTEWVHDVRRSRLRFAYGPADTDAATSALIDDALAAALAAGLLNPAGRDRGGPVEGVVVGCPTSSQAMVKLDDGYAAVQVGIVFPGLNAERVFTSGMRVRGLLNRATRQLDLRPALPDPAGRLAEVPDGAVLPARVEAVEASSCLVAVHPALPLAVPAERVAANGDDLRDLLSEGEIVAVRYQAGPQGPVLALAGADPGRCGPALALLPGGPPWLPPPPTEAPGPAEDDAGTADLHPPVPAPAIPMAGPMAGPAPAPRPAQAPPAPVPEPARPSPMDLARRGSRPPPPVPVSTGKAVRDLGLALDAARNSELVARSTVRDLRAEVILLRRDLAAANRELEHRDETLRRLRRRYRAARIGPVPQPPEGEALFSDPVEQFRFEVTERWARRIPAADKAARPLRPYVLGPDFLATLGSVAGIERGKVIDVVVELLTGLADNLTGRDMHALRSGPGPGTEPLRRDGRTCWRVALQQGTPSARRLHFWRGSEEIELSRVVLHDDFTP